MWIEYEKAVEVLAERYGLVMLCEEKGLPFAREARDEGRFGVWVVSRASGVDYCEVLTDGLDEHGDVIYRWNQSRTFVEGGE